MAGRGNAGGKMRGKHARQDESVGGSNPRGPVTDPIGRGAGDAGDERGRSGSSPGHLKKAAGARSARDFAPGRGGRSPGSVGRATPADQDEGETLV